MIEGEVAVVGDVPVCVVTDAVVRPDGPAAVGAVSDEDVYYGRVGPTGRSRGRRDRTGTPKRVGRR